MSNSQINPSSLFELALYIFVTFFLSFCMLGLLGPLPGGFFLVEISGLKMKRTQAEGRGQIKIRW